MQQLMGKLPPARVNPGHPFLHTGVDFAGPFTLKSYNGRCNKTFKCYFAVFVCFATKAVHLEAVTDLTSDGFIATFKHFVSRRGLCTDMYSDCGTNFVGADKELKAMLESSKNQATFSHYLADQGVSWHHQGGLWEAGVKAIKFHLIRVVG